MYNTSEHLRAKAGGRKEATQWNLMSKRHRNTEATQHGISFHNLEEHPNILTKGLLNICNKRWGGCDALAWKEVMNSAKEMMW